MLLLLMCTFTMSASHQYIAQQHCHSTAEVSAALLCRRQVQVEDQASLATLPRLLMALASQLRASQTSTSHAPWSKPVRLWGTPAPPPFRCPSGQCLFMIMHMKWFLSHDPKFAIGGQLVVCYMLELRIKTLQQQKMNQMDSPLLAFRL